MRPLGNCRRPGCDGHLELNPDTGAIVCSLGHVVQAGQLQSVGRRRRSDATVVPALKPSGIALEISTEARGRALVRLCQGLTWSRCLELAESAPEALEMIGALQELLQALVAAGLAPRADRGSPA